MRVGSSWSWLNWVCCDWVMAWFGGIGLGWSDGDELAGEGSSDKGKELRRRRSIWPLGESLFKILPPSLGQLMLDCLLMAILQYCMFDAWSPRSPLRFHLPGALEEISSSKIL